MFANSRLCHKVLGRDSDAIDFDSMWNVLSSSLREIHTKNASKLSFEELYRNAYKLVLKKQGESLYERVKEFEQDWLVTVVRPAIMAELSPILLIRDGDGSSSLATTSERRRAGERLMLALKQSWEDHNLCMSMTTDVLMYMVSVHLPTRGLEKWLSWLQKGGLIMNRNASTALTTEKHLYFKPPWANFETMYYGHRFQSNKT